MTIYAYRANGDRIDLDTNEALGSGGEGSVWINPFNPSRLIKIYEHPTLEHEKKLKAFIARGFSLPSCVAAPEELLFNKGGRVIGYSMPFIKGARTFRDLANKNFRTSNKINNLFVAQLHLKDIKNLEAIHRQRIIVGDGNDQNKLFSGTDSFYIDFDSVQFDDWPCPVAMESFLDPALYGIDLSQKPVFNVGSDYYSFAVILFRSLLLVHPYGGTHPKVDELTHRALRRITVFDKDVIYPAIGLPPDLISDDLLQVFNKYFKDGWRGPFPQMELEQFKSALIECSSCKTAYPKNKRVCPVCKEQNQVATAISIPGSLTVKQLLSLKGQILYHRLEGENVLLVILENDQAALYLVNQALIQRIDLFPYRVGMRFEVSNKLVAVNIAGTDQIDLYEIDHGEIIQIESTNADVYIANQNAAFRVNGSHLYRLTGSQLVDTEIYHGHLLNRVIRSTIEHQSWFNISSDLKPTLLGFYRVLRQQFFWIHSDNYSADLTVPDLDMGENLSDLTIKFSGNSTLLIRKTSLSGLELVRFDAFDKKGNSLYSLRLEAKKLPSDTIHGLAYSMGKLIFPTDIGAVRFDPATGQQTQFQATNKAINSSQAIYPYGSGLLVLDPRNVSYLILN